jgi:hypothetical protein
VNDSFTWEASSFIPERVLRRTEALGFLLIQEE